MINVTVQELETILSTIDKALVMHEAWREHIQRTWACKLQPTEADTVLGKTKASLDIHYGITSLVAGTYIEQLINQAERATYTVRILEEWRCFTPMTGP